ncbi:MAG: DNA polymerase III subunit beta [Deltaproteobacteria bacterium]
MLNIEIKKNDIIEKLANIQSIVDKKSIATILNNIFLYTNNDNLYLEVTDLEINYRTKIKSIIKEHGEITINAKKIYELIREFPCEDIFLQENENLWIRITDGNNLDFKIGGLPPDDYPRFKELKKNNSIRIDSNILNEMIEKTIISVSLDETKYNLIGLLFEYEKKDEKNIIRMVGSDGHKLSLVEKYLDELDKNDFYENISFIIPKKGAQEIKKITEKNNKVMFGVDGKFCFVDTEDETLSIRLVDSKFPNYKSIIPKNRETIVKFDKNSMINSLKRVSIVMMDSSLKSVLLRIKNNNMEIETIEKEFGEAREKIEVDYMGNDIIIGLNTKLLISLLSVMKSQEVEMTINGKNSPILLSGKDDKGFLGLVMPLTNLEG